MKINGQGMFEPDWPAPPNVRSFITTRRGGVSQSPFDALNLAMHVGDHPLHVAQNRERLYGSTGRVVWLEQVHGVEILNLDGKQSTAKHIGDGAISRQRRVVCAVLTADCLPVLMTTRRGRCVAAVHAGWRGMAGGVLAKAVEKFECHPGDIMAYLGPAISQAHFEVGEDVLKAFRRAERHRVYGEPTEASFSQCKDVPGKYYANLYRLARSELNGLGVTAVFGGHFCTYSDKARFFSYRRDGTTGRIASLIWIADTLS